MTTYTKLKDEYTDLLTNMEVRSDWKDAVDRKARSIYANKARYEEVSSKTNVPWYVIGLIHSLEANLDFTCNLHNGEPYNKKTRLVPRGRGPFSSWEEAACDALAYDGLDKVSDWTDERVCYELEKYNGFGYRTKRTGVLSPYLWSGTTHYTTGKYVSDGKFVRTAKSQQIGAIPLYLRLKEIDIPKKEIIANSSKLSLISRARKSLAGISFTGLMAEAFGYLEPVKDFILENKYFFAAGAFIGGFVLLKLLETKGVNDYKEGRYIPSGQKEDSNAE